MVDGVVTDVDVAVVAIVDVLTDDVVVDVLLCIVV